MLTVITAKFIGKPIVPRINCLYEKRFKELTGYLKKQMFYKLK